MVLFLFTSIPVWYSYYIATTFGKTSKQFYYGIDKVYEQGSVRSTERKQFVTNVGKTFTREQLMEKIWGYDYFGETRTVDVHIRHLRIKLSVLPEIAESLETMRGIGYKLRNP